MINAMALAALIFAAAILYSSVGHAGASGYLAAMAIMGLAPEAMRPTALTLNILVAVIATARFHQAGLFDWRTFWPLALASVPAAFVGGTLHLPSGLYRPVVGAMLLLGALELLRSARRGAAREGGPAVEATPVPIVPAMLIGAAIGLLSGLTGTGGGIFLSPVLLLLGWVETRRASGMAAAFILLNSMAALAGTTFAPAALPAAVPLWLAAAGLGAMIGTRLGTRVLPPAGLRYALSAVLVVAGSKLILT